MATLAPVAERLAATGGREAAQACLYLVIAQLALDEREAARSRFRQALGHEPSLRLSPDRFSPKVIGAIEEARHEREAEARASAPPAKPEAGKSHTGRTVLVAGVAAAAGVGILYAVGQGDTNPPGDGQVTFTGARFAGAGPISQGVTHNLGQVTHELVVAREAVRRDPHHRPIIGDSNEKITTLGI